ncbi:hypothetical protein J3459_008426 [Metarhizium acridum]|uniref:uncharacterized protein n=1 Tax=Metarhizium acridum TaxID=92637 RepID=UPI001C6BE26D|nr:hypothetical protein J3458_000137 [Metarhizium acridum]KAG8426107.1 hypothetical protein J3459_008426 [Metarhizium acridum]
MAAAFYYEPKQCQRKVVDSMSMAACVRLGRTEVLSVNARSTLNAIQAAACTGASFGSKACSVLKVAFIRPPPLTRRLNRNKVDFQAITHEQGDRTKATVGDESRYIINTNYALSI